MQTDTDYVVDRTGWAPGPWDGEPDRIEWRSDGLPCLMVRNWSSGNWCGYVAVDRSHPWHGKDYDAVDVDVHGGLTYARACAGHICHVPQPGEPDDVWWFGFDCGHYRDRSPGMEAHLQSVRSVFGAPHDGEEYRDVAYVRAEVERLAAQVKGGGG